MSDANPLWGAARIHGELLKLGIDVSQATVAKYMSRRRRPRSPTWRTFVANHAARPGHPLAGPASPRASGGHCPSDRRMDRPSTPRGLSRERDATVSPPRSRQRLRRCPLDDRQHGYSPDPDRTAFTVQNAYVERVIGSIRHDVSRSRHRAQRGRLATNPRPVREVLPILPHSPRAGEGYADLAARLRPRIDCLRRAGRRAASSLRTPHRIGNAASGHHRRHARRVTPWRARSPR